MGDENIHHTIVNIPLQEAVAVRPGPLTAARDLLKALKCAVPIARETAGLTPVVAELVVRETVGLPLILAGLVIGGTTLLVDVDNTSESDVGSTEKGEDGSLHGCG